MILHGFGNGSGRSALRKSGGKTAAAICISACAIGPGIFLLAFGELSSLTSLKNGNVKSDMQKHEPDRRTCGRDRGAI
jgi:hypothetical protein